MCDKTFRTESCLQGNESQTHQKPDLLSLWWNFWDIFMSRGACVNLTFKVCDYTFGKQSCLKEPVLKDHEIIKKQNCKVFNKTFWTHLIKSFLNIWLYLVNWVCQWIDLFIFVTSSYGLIWGHIENQVCRLL